MGIRGLDDLKNMKMSLDNHRQFKTLVSDEYN